MNTQEPLFVADTQVRIGHVHLKVADLDRALAFYSGVLGLQLMARLGDSVAFFPPEATTTTSDSTPGRASAVPHPHPEPPASTIRPFSTPPERPWRKPCTAFSLPKSPSTALPTTAPARPSTSAIPTKTASN